MWPSDVGAMTAKCPICGAPAAQKSKPFCSPRCADVDLNRWFTGAYSVPVVEMDDEDLDHLMEEQGGGDGEDGY